MNGIITDVLRIIEHAKESGNLPEGVSENNAEYVAEVLRLGIKNTEEEEITAYATH